VLIVVAQLLAFIGLSIIIQWAKAIQLVPIEFGRPLRYLTICYAIGAGWILFRGLRPSRQRPEVPGAAIWSRRKLAVSFAATFLLFMMTIWNLDVAVKQRVAALRVEAGALAASVAPAQVPHRDNAAVIYRQASEWMPAAPDNSWYSKWNAWLEQGSSDFDPDDAELLQFLEDQATTLRLLRQAGEKPGCCFEHDYAHPGNYMVPGLLSIQAGSTLLALDARSKAAAGDFRTALVNTNAMFMMAEHAGSEPLLIGVLASAREDRRAFATLEVVLSSKKASTDELSLLDISDTFSYQRLLDRSLWMEEACTVATYCDYGATFGPWWGGYGGPLLKTRWLGPVWDKCFSPLYNVFVFDDELASYREILGEVRQLTGRPYYQVTEEWRSFRERPETAMRGLFVSLMLPGMPHAAEAAAEADARRRLARLAVLVSRYRASEGEFPETLDILVPDYLLALPLDPFDGKPLRIKRTDQELILYSVGRNGADDDGAPYDAKKRTGDLTFRLPESLR
jgi:hypothetical protein